MELKRVVVTGLGAVTPLGNNPEETWNNLLNGVSGAAPITLFDASSFKTQFACEVKDLKVNDYIDRKEARKMDRYAQLAIIAAMQAVQDSGMNLDEEDKNRIGVIYTTVLRGTPMVIQLLILYYVVFAWSSNGLLVASLSFGLNSGAYVSEIFRSGIMSIDKGQFEAGSSLGFHYIQTMWYIIAPQMFKNVLPTLANEFITLLKETSIAGYATVMDLTFAGNRIRGVTYSPFMPLIAVALIYLAMVMLLTYFVGKLERRLRQSDNR